MRAGYLNRDHRNESACNFYEEKKAPGVPAQAMWKMPDRQAILPFRCDSLAWKSTVVDPGGKRTCVCLRAEDRFL